MLQINQEYVLVFTVMADAVSCWVALHCVEPTDISACFGQSPQDPQYINALNEVLMKTWFKIFSNLKNVTY